MRLQFWNVRKASLILALVAMSRQFAWAGPLPERFTLGRCVPADAWMYVHAVTNPDRAWIAAKWSEVFAELKKSGVDKEVIKLVMSALADNERAEAQAMMDKVVALIQGVKWGELAEHEFVFSERPSSSMLGFDYILLVQGKAGSGETNAAGLIAILKELATLSGSTINQSKLHDADVWELTNEGFGRIGLSIALFRHQDTIGLMTGRKTLEDVVGLLTGKAPGKSIIGSPRFQEALTLVDPPSDSISYFDTKAFMSSLRTMFQNIEKKAKAANAEGTKADSDDEKGLELVVKLLDRIDVFDYSIASVATRSNREMRSDAMRLQNGKEAEPIVRAIINRKPFEKFDQFIPAEATGFNLSGSVDLEVIYDMAIDFVNKEIPDGPGAIAKWNDILASAGFSPKTDVFAWWSGEMASITMPPAVVTPMGGSDSVLMIRVKDAAIANQKLDALVNFVKGLIQAKGQMLMVSPAKLSVEGFREITHPSLAMFMKPVVGVHGDWMIVGTSSSAIQKCIDVSTGKSPSVMKNQRFADEGLVPKGSVRAASFTDTSKTGQELAAAAGMIGMFGGMAVAGLPETNAEEKQGKQIMQSALGILMKLAPVLGKIDFYSSSSSICTFDGKLTMRTDSVTTYKKNKDGATTAEAPK